MSIHRIAYAHPENGGEDLAKMSVSVNSDAVFVAIAREDDDEDDARVIMLPRNVFEAFLAALLEYEGIEL